MNRSPDLREAGPGSSRSKSASSHVELRGVRVHNLQNIDLDIPLNQLVVISGVSGSGKSSLAFDTIFAEGQRRYIEGFSLSSRKSLERIERPDADRIAHLPVTLAIRGDATRSGGRLTVATIAELLDGLRSLFARIGQIVCPGCGRAIHAHTSTDVVNAINGLPEGTRCQLVFEVANDSGSEPASTWLARGFSRGVWNGSSHSLDAKAAWPTAGPVWLVADRLVSGKAPAERIMESARVAFQEGRGRCVALVERNQSPSGATRSEQCEVDGKLWQVERFSQRLECPACQRQFLPIESRLFSHLSIGACLVCRGVGHVENDAICSACRGSRYRDEALAVRIADQNIADLCAQNASSLLAFLGRLAESLEPQSLAQSQRIRTDLERRLAGVRDLGLDYLTLNRSAETLSGGEYRRLSLAAVIGSKITGTLVIVDEPSAGLSVPELPNVAQALRRVQSLRNSVIAVEHAPQIVAAADYVIELGPGAGPRGGQICFQGAPADLVREEGVRNQIGHLVPDTFFSDTAPQLRLTNIQHRFLRERQQRFPLGKLCVVTGASGTGKTTLVTRILYPAVCQRLGLTCSVRDPGVCELTGFEPLSDVVLIDQSPLARSSRSNPATWLEVFDEIRETFANTADARQRGFTALHFSFNSARGGRCRSCLGTGQLRHDMQFLPDVTIVCPECQGTRYRPEILDVKYRGRSIADALAMSISEAASFFRSQPRLQSRFQILKQIGLDYLVLGQPSETLSGGEAQRLKLAARIIKPVTGRGLIISDEPTTGLHPRDVQLLIACFRELLASGQSLILADNSPELLQAADYVVELTDAA